MAAHPVPLWLRMLLLALASLMALVGYLLLGVWAASFGDDWAPIKFLFISVWALGLALPAGAVGLSVVLTSPRSARFATICTLVAFMATLGQAGWVLGSHFFSGERLYGWDNCTSDFLGGWHLAAPPIIAALLWLVSVRRPFPAARPAIGGLFFSIAAIALLAIPLGLCLVTFRR